MKITKEAAVIINRLLKESHSDALVVKIGISSCCGSRSIQLDLGNAKDFSHVISVDGISVALSEDDEKELEQMTLSARGDELVLESNECDCGDGGCGCH